MPEESSAAMTTAEFEAVRDLLKVLSVSSEDIAALCEQKLAVLNPELQHIFEDIRSSMLALHQAVARVHLLKAQQAAMAIDEITARDEEAEELEFSRWICPSFLISDDTEAKLPEVLEHTLANPHQINHPVQPSIGFVFDQNSSMWRYGTATTSLEDDHAKLLVEQGENPTTPRIEQYEMSGTSHVEQDKVPAIPFTAEEEDDLTHPSSDLVAMINVITDVSEGDSSILCDTSTDKVTNEESEHLARSSRQRQIAEDTMDWDEVTITGTMHKRIRAEADMIDGPTDMECEGVAKARVNIEDIGRSGHAGAPAPPQHK